MKTQIRALIVTVCLALISLNSQMGFAGVEDPSLDSRQHSSAKSPDPLLAVDLLKLQKKETEGKTASEVQLLNANSLEALKNLNLEPTVADRVSRLDQDQIHDVIESIDQLDLIRQADMGEYNQPGVEIGYCFGRATYVHLALLKIGVDKNSIRKAWLVGPMKTGSTNWQFHVSTIVRGTDGNWYAVDNFFHGEVKDVKAWAESFQPLSTDGRLRIYITDPKKFSVSLSTYSRLQMGLDLDPSTDWYRGFFQQLMAWFRTGDLSEVGLKRLIPELSGKKN